MLREELPDDVLKLRPRKLRLGRDTERILEDVCEAGNETRVGGRNNRLRPNADSINAIRCADCGQVEYITRDYCRCGHYLAGQVMDEFLAWEHELIESHNRLAAEAEEKMKPVRRVGVIALLFFIWPLYQGVLTGGQMPLTTWFWFLPGLVTISACALLEKTVTAKRDTKAQLIEAASIEQYLNERTSVPSN